MKAIALNLRSIEILQGGYATLELEKLSNMHSDFMMFMIYEFYIKKLRHHRNVALTEDYCTFEDPFEIGLTNQN